MKKRILKKLRAKAGETLAETLVSTLIAALALMMLAGAISAANSAITGSRRAMNEYNDTTVSAVRTEWKEAANTALTTNYE